MDLTQLDFQQLRVKHIAFKSKVRLVLYGGDYDHIIFTKENPVTKWFTSVGYTKYKNETETLQLAVIHKNFSSIAEKLINLYQEGDIDQAHNGMIELNEVSNSFLSLLDGFQSRLSHN